MTSDMIYEMAGLFMKCLSYFETLRISCFRAFSPLIFASCSFRPPSYISFFRLQAGYNFSASHIKKIKSSAIAVMDNPMDRNLNQVVNKDSKGILKSKGGES